MSCIIFILGLIGKFFSILGPISILFGIKVRSDSKFHLKRGGITKEIFAGEFCVHLLLIGGGLVITMIGLALIKSVENLS